MLSSIYKIFSKIPDPRSFTKPTIVPIVDHCMAGLAVFGLKCSSLLDYDNKRSTEVIAKNLHDLYRLDEVDPNGIRPAFKKIFDHFQRGKGLEEFEFLDGYVLLTLHPRSQDKEHDNESVKHLDDLHQIG
jgi:hypothetical protein